MHKSPRNTRAIVEKLPGPFFYSRALFWFVLEEGWWCLKEFFQDKFRTKP
jgi:hypothetical protein